MRLVALSLALLAVAAPAGAQEFTFMAAGDLVDGSGEGLADDVVYAPGMLFPIGQPPAFANSQVYNPGGYLGPGGGQCDELNYSYPWRDNYCEIRSWDMPLCPAGTGHQGQDIRPATCDKDVHAAVAAVDGTITNIGSYSVYLTAADGTRYDYLHMSGVTVSVGQDVSRGETLGMVSNEFGGTPTSIHLHFNIRQNVVGLGSVYVPPYTSLVASYQQLVDGPAIGALEAVGCDVIAGWAFDADAPEQPVPVVLSFDGASAEPALSADLYRGDLCENLGFCDHGFEVPSPLSLFDAAGHDVGASVQDTAIDGSPLTLDCEPPELAGVKRAVDVDAWQLSSFWDMPPVPQSEVNALPEGESFGSQPVLWQTDDALYLHDAALGDVLRPVSDAAARAWRFDVATAQSHADTAEMIIGADLPPRPIMLRDGDGETYLLDVDDPSVPGLGGGMPTASGISGANDGCGCGVRTGGSKEGWLWLLVGLGVAVARRRGPRSFEPVALGR